MASQPPGHSSSNAEQPQVLQQVKQQLLRVLLLPHEYSAPRQQALQPQQVLQQG